MPLNDLHISIVFYNTPSKFLENCLHSLEKVSLKFILSFIDNSPSISEKLLKKLEDFKHLGFKIKYIKTSRNLGYGKAHNLAILESLEKRIPYHLILNPDVYFGSGVLEEICDFLEVNSKVGLVTPKVLYSQGNLQYICRLLPSPFNLIGRRFASYLPFKRFFEKLNYLYELRFTSYNNIMEVPYLSGCFMFIRTEVFKKAGLFDEQYFMYMEDVDLCRRIWKYYKNIYLPKVYIYHHHQKSSYNDKKLLKIHINSAIKYFNKWGWLFDYERKKINREVLNNLGYSSKNIPHFYL